MNFTWNQERLRIRKHLFQLSLTVLLATSGFVGYEFYESRVKSAIIREEGEAKLALYTDYIASGRLIGLSDDELITLLGRPRNSEGYLDPTGGIRFREWFILNYYQKNQSLFYFTKYLSVGSKDGKVQQVEITERD